MRLTISSCVIEIIHRAAAAAGAREACGLLFGHDGRIDGCEPTRNLAARPERAFEIDPAALIAALRAERQGGRPVAGYFHSHPGGDPLPSITDAAMAAADGRIWLIAGGGEIGAWRAVPNGATHGRFDPVGYQVVMVAADAGHRVRPDTRSEPAP
ncbi:M67 family metallopeptidase [Sphingomonas sp.]|uniref:M67 family metallopeptidase n=1 Tax=Sphingomonas sp. TaxID=28214 RepID=UPI002DD67CD9|nr:M67 family metallopeptidase [Sphingomonas sp.]